MVKLVQMHKATMEVSINISLQLQTLDDPSGVIPSVKGVLYNFLNEEFFTGNQSICRLRILENQRTKVTAADPTGRDRELS